MYHTVNTIAYNTPPLSPPVSTLEGGDGTDMDCCSETDTTATAACSKRCAQHCGCGRAVCAWVWVDYAIIEGSPLCSVMAYATCPPQHTYGCIWLDGGRRHFYGERTSQRGGVVA